MKRLVEGKRLSKRERLEFSTWTELVAHQQAMTHVGAHAQMGLDVEAARAGLLARDLPADVLVIDDTGGRRLDVYMADRKFCRDTPEDLFARMIVAWDRLCVSVDREDVIQHTFLFAEARTLAAAYLVDSEAHRQPGTAGARKRWEGKEPITNAIKSLAKLRDGLGDPLGPRELWPKLYAALDEAGLEPRDDGDCYRYAGGAITREAFRKAVQLARE